MTTPGEEPDVLRVPPFIAKRRVLIRRVAMFASITSVLLVVSAGSMIIRNGCAHDEASCPFHVVETRAVEGARVTDEARTCIDGLTEHRWRVLRDGQEELEIGRRMLATELYAGDSYRWEPSVEGTHVRVRVENTGTRAIVYREEIARQGRQE